MADTKDRKNKNVIVEDTKDRKKKNVIVDTSHDDDHDAEYGVDTGKDCGLSLEKLSLGPKKKLLILSLGGLLLHRVYRYARHKIPKSRRYDGVYGSFLVYKRPFCDDFLKFCFERFEVGLWSSAQERNIDNALDCIMRELRGKLAFVWDQNNCTKSGFKALDNIQKTIFLKELKKLWENADSTSLGGKGKYSSVNTLMIDDNPYKSLLNPPNTAIFLNEYNADDANDTLLGPKGELRKYLDEVASCDDVPKYVKGHPFGNPAISSSHPDWPFYSKIITQFRRDIVVPVKKNLVSNADTIAFSYLERLDKQQSKMTRSGKVRGKGL